MLEKVNLFHLTDLITGAIDVKMEASVLEGKSSFKIFGFSFSSYVDWGRYILSIAETASKEICALIGSVKFRSPEVALCLCKSTLRSCMEYFCHVWAGAPSCYLNMLDKLHKRVFRNVEFALFASLEPLAHRRNIAILGVFCSYYFGRCLSELP